MQEITRAQLTGALCATEKPSQQRRLNDSEFQRLTLLLSQMADRYPSQDLSDSFQGYLWDYERLAMRYSLARVEAALAEFRITPNRSYFPRPDEIADLLVQEIEREEHSRRIVRQQADDARRHREFWEWFDGRIASDGGVVNINGKPCRTDAHVLAACPGRRPRAAADSPD